MNDAASAARAGGPGAHLHIHSEAADPAPLHALLLRLRETLDLRLTFSASDPSQAALFRTLATALPFSEAGQRAAVLLHHGPVARLDLLRPAMRRIRQGQLKAFFTDFRVALSNWQRLTGGSGALRALLNGAAHLWVDDASTEKLIGQLSPPRKNVTVCQRLHDVPPAPPCDETRRQQFVRAAGGRPSWFASEIHIDELGAVMSAQTALQRRLHNLLLIVSMRRTGDTAAARERLVGAGYTILMDGPEPELSRDTEVLLAQPGDGPLWYRIAPVTLMGCSFVAEDVARPWSALTLGSALVHGPRTAPCDSLYERLDMLGAARRVDRPEQIATAVGQTLAPDRAAEMAAAGWRCATSGAQLTNDIVERVEAAIEAI